MRPPALLSAPASPLGAHADAAEEEAVNESTASPSRERPSAQRDAAINEFAHRFLSGPNRDLYEDMLVTLCRLARDGASRGDVKLLQRSLAELRYGLKVFAPYREVRKISIFGSARTAEAHGDYQAAEEFARRMCAAGWMIITGAGDGIMRAGHGGAGREASFGVAIRLPFEQKTNEFIADDEKLINFRYFFTRKVMFLKESSAVALFPGGFGTQDEGFEALTLVQTGKAPLIPIVMCEQPGGGYWAHWRNYVQRELLGSGMINAEDMSLFKVTDSIAEAVEEIVRFYRVFHSMRYVGDDLVLRLNAPIGDALLARLNDEFVPGLATGGAIVRSAPLPPEADDHPEKPRLVLRFNKKSFGLLRRMIDTINAD